MPSVNHNRARILRKDKLPTGSTRRPRLVRINRLALFTRRGGRVEDDILGIIITIRGINDTTAAPAPTARCKTMPQGSTSSSGWGRNQHQSRFRREQWTGHENQLFHREKQSVVIRNPSRSADVPSLMFKRSKMSSYCLRPEQDQTVGWRCRLKCMRTR